MTHTDHPARHWDRTCPACIADRAGLVIDYMRLRLAIGVLGVLLPFVLVAVAGERESISAYYHSPARDVFVGALTAIACLLLAYRGYDRGDRVCSALAGVALLVVAYVPVGGATGPWHLAGSVAFFGSVAVLADRFGRGGKRRTFRGLALGIVGCIAWATVAGVAGGSIYAPEALAVLLFGAAWIFKGRAA